jgi:UDP-2,3-diacylglucosamine hydrolase
MSQSQARASANPSALAVICGAGSLPFALAEAAKARNRRVVLFALRGWADAKRVASYPHHWLWIGQFGRFMKLAAAEGCSEVTFIGSVTRPSIFSMRPDFLALRHLPQIIRMFRGGDDHLQGVIARAFEQRGMRLVGPKDIAPELLMPHGSLGAGAPNARDRADIARGLALLKTTSPFDIGQAVVVADNQVLAVEGPEGTDRMLGRVAELRANGRIRSPLGAGVLVKAPKVGQDQRLDLPTIGPDTVVHAASANLAGIAVVAGSSIIAEPGRVVAAANNAGLFVIGVSEDGTEQ